MKKVKAYWTNLEWKVDENNQYRKQEVRHNLEIEVPDGATEKEIEDIAHRKDVIIIK